MPEKRNCEIGANAAEKDYSLCRMLSVVDAARSDTEYFCWGCENRQVIS